MSDAITYEARGSLRLMGLNRVEKRNALDLPMIEALADAYGEFARDPEARCAVVFAHGDHFCAGLDVRAVAPRIMPLTEPGWIPPGGIDPWGIKTPRCPKPVIVAVQGYCMTLAIELVLASDIAVAASDASFAQLEITRGIYPFWGATTRLPLAVGYQNAMRWLLTGDTFDAAEAHRIGLVQEVVEPGRQLERAIAIAERVAAAAPLGVAATLRTARLAQDAGPAAASGALQAEAAAIFTTEDAKVGIATFLDRQRPTYQGR